MQGKKSRLSETFRELCSNVKDDLTREKIQYPSVTTYTKINDYVSKEWEKFSKCLLKKGNF